MRSAIPVDGWRSHCHRVERRGCVLLRGSAHALDECDGIRDWKHLALVVMRKGRQRIVDDLDATPVQQRSVAPNGYEDGPASVIRNPDDRTVFCHDHLGITWAGGQTKAIRWIPIWRARWRH